MNKIITILLLLLLGGCSVNVEAKNSMNDISGWAETFCDYETNVEYLVSRYGDFATVRYNLDGTFKACD